MKRKLLEWFTDPGWWNDPEWYSTPLYVAFVENDLQFARNSHEDVVRTWRWFEGETHDLRQVMRYYPIH